MRKNFSTAALVLFLLAPLFLIAAETYQFTYTGAEIEALYGIVTNLEAVDGILEGDGAGNFIEIDTEAELETAIGSPNLIVETEIDTVAKIETITSEDIVTFDEVDTEAELEAAIGSPNIIVETEINSVSKIETITSEDIVTSDELPSDTDTNTQFGEGKSIAALTVGDETPEVASGNVYDCTGATTVDITDFVDSDGDHTEFSDGDWFEVWMNADEVTIQFYENAFIQGNAEVPFTGSDTNFVKLHFDFDEGADAWVLANAHGMRSASQMQIEDINLGAGTIQGAPKVFTLTADTDLSILTHSGAKLATTAALDLGLWDCKTDTLGTFADIWVKDASEQVNVYCYEDTTSDLLVISDGTTLDLGDEAALSTTGNEHFRFECLEANKWYTNTSFATSTDGGVHGGLGFTHQWDGLNGSGTNYIDLNDDASSEAGTLSGAQIDTFTNFSISDPGGSDYCLKLDAADDYLRFTGVAASGAPTSEFTLAFDLYSAPTAGNSEVFKIYYDGNTYFTVFIRANNTIGVAHKGDGTYYDELSTEAFADSTWERILVSVSVSTEYISIKVGADAWEDFSTSLDSFADTPTALYLGDGPISSNNADDVYLHNVKMVNTYKDESL